MEEHNISLSNPGTFNQGLRAPVTEKSGDVKCQKNKEKHFPKFLDTAGHFN
jgi:hypothetical protein